MKLSGANFLGNKLKGWGIPLAHRSARLSRNRAQGATGQRVQVLAFTLIELLVVIAIIGALAALVVGLAGLSSRKLRESRVRAELNVLVNAIEGYRADVGFYPASNTNNPQLNPLFYELSGAIFTNQPSPRFITLGSSEEITPAALRSAFFLPGIQNSSRDPRGVEYDNFAPKPSQYMTLMTNIGGATDIQVLVVPFPGPRMVAGKAKGNPNSQVMINPWFYDSSSTNRHNGNEGFDLWAEITVGKTTQIIGNWRE